MMSWKQMKGPLAVVAVTLLMLFIILTSQLFVIWPFLNKTVNTQSLVILATLNFLALMIFLNYYLTCLTDPGTVPIRWMPRQQAYVEVKKSTHTPRYCKTCRNNKPPRTHHCSVCKRCVLKMDHHCPWVNNCVGFHNYCYFFRFLIYVDISSIYLFTLLSCRLAQLIRDLRNSHIKPTALEATFLSINLILTACIIVAVGILTGYHLYCITTNTTTIEGWEKGRSLTIKGMGKIQKVICPYDQGIYNNLKTVLGPWPIFWLLPIPMAGKGLDFPITTKYVEEESMNENDFSSTVSLNRQSVVESEWSYEMSTLTPAKTKESLHTLASPTIPVESTITFVSTTTTLVDYAAKSTKHNSLHYPIPIQ